MTERKSTVLKASLLLNTLAMTGCVLALLLGLGICVEFVYVSALATVVRLWVDAAYLRKLKFLLPIAVLVLLIGVEGSLARESKFSVDGAAIKYLILFLAACAGIFSMFDRPVLGGIFKWQNLAVSFAGVFVVLQIAACLVRHNDTGLFTNMHYLGLYAAIMLPLLFYLLANTRGATCFAATLFLALDFTLLLLSQSRPAWLAVLLGALAVTPLLRGRTRLISLFSTVLLPTVLYVTGTLGFDKRINSLVENFMEREERVGIFQESLRMQMTSTWTEWVFGRGFGSFFDDYKAYSSFRSLADFQFPHNFLLEILYVNGVVGLLAISGVFGCFLYRLLIGVKMDADPAKRDIALLLLATVLIHQAHTFLTVSFFSRYTMIPLGILVGAALGLFTVAREVRLPVPAERG